ncbi:FAD/NAD(P)-binding domain-containing protein [Sparassis latifolia]|uniref:FAD/NAD(P)-binding domain-containing protein n=1 Tax=Sparassis crispa TaxID=139825 RepID=A0A401GX51_9APHY|nr:FAD/NAD(P)-binding domain-containing protein [Sparassis crispa]GBE86344.1 FAD/NAD(P)-binding domain-containing protein [Sparassis crispa]
MVRSESPGPLLRLDFLVSGGGIAGLAVAFVLAQSGHRVRVIDKHDLTAPSGPLRVPPNLSKILRRWVGPEELARVTTRCTRSPFLDMITGELVGHLHWTPAVMAEAGGEFLVMHHADCHRMLYELAISVGVQTDFNTSVVAIHQGTEALPNPSVSLSSGEVLTADFLIAADGPNSFIREVIWGPDEEKVPKMTLYTGVVPTEKMLAYPELQPIYGENDDWPIFMGSDRSMCIHRVRGKREFGFHLYSHLGDQYDCQGGDEGWDEKVPTDSVNYKNQGHSQRMQRLLNMTSSLIRTRFVERPDDAIEDWADETGRIVLIGEAAHPWFPGGSHGAAMAVEDAVVFGTLFGRLKSWLQAPSFISAYQELRQGRCKAVKVADIANAHLVAMPPGPMRDARNASVSRELDEWDEGTLKAQFEEIAEVFGYDAADAADEWWVNWGRFSESERGAPVSKHMSWAGFQTTAAETTENQANVQ